MTRHVTEWIAECAECQKIRAGDPAVVAIPSPIGSLCIFEEISIDFVGPLPKDGVGNTGIFSTLYVIPLDIVNYLQLRESLQ